MKMLKIKVFSKNYGFINKDFRSIKIWKKITISIKPTLGERKPRRADFSVLIKRKNKEVKISKFTIPTFFFYYVFLRSGLNFSPKERKISTSCLHWKAWKGRETNMNDSSMYGYFQYCLICEFIRKQF